MKTTKSNTSTVVLVHGAWADGSSWNEVIEPLQAQGLHVVAAPMPLTSLKDDVQALEHVLDRTTGPVVLGAHAYGGAVISAMAHERITGLVFIAALAPDQGESVADVFYREQPHAEAPQLAPDNHDAIWMPEPGFAKVFAQHASSVRVALMAATQRPIFLPCLQEKASHASWRHTPSWYLIAEEDRMIHPKTQRFMAERMGARIRSEKVDHTPMITAPARVVEVFADAVATLSA